MAGTLSGNISGAMCSGGIWPLAITLPPHKGEQEVFIPWEMFQISSLFLLGIPFGPPRLKEEMNKPGEGPDRLMASSAKF